MEEGVKLRLAGSPPRFGSMVGMSGPLYLCTFMPEAESRGGILLWGMKSRNKGYGLQRGMLVSQAGIATLL